MLCGLFPMLSFAQGKDCQTLLQEKMPVKQAGIITEKIQQLNGCGLDSIDVMLVSNENVLNAFIVKEVQENNNTQPTYGDFVQYVNTLKAVPAYQQSKYQASRLLALKNKRASLQGWDEDTKIFTEVGYSARDLAAVKQLLKDNPNKGWSYEALFNTYGAQTLEKQKQAADSTKRAAVNEQIEVLQETRRRLAKYCDTSKIVINNFYMPGFTNYDDAMSCAKKAKLPLLLYFNNNNCADCKRMESIVFNYDIIRNELKNYILADINLGDKTLLPKKEQVYSKTLQRKLMTTGDKNADMELTKYGSSDIPYFVISNERMVIDHKGFTPDWVEYFNFLKDGIKKFLKQQ